MEPSKYVYILEIMDSKTGEKVVIYFKKQITKKKVLKIISDSDFWDEDKERILRPFIPILENLSEHNLIIKGIFVSRTFYFKEISRHLIIKREPIW